MFFYRNINHVSCGTTAKVPFTVHNHSLSLSYELACTGIINGGEGFASLLNLDGVDGVFGGQPSAPPQPGRPNPKLSINLSLLDEDGGADLGGDTAGGSFDLSSWGLGLPSVSEATSSVRLLF